MKVREKEVLFNCLKYIIVRLDNIGSWEKESNPKEKVRKGLNKILKELKRVNKE